MILDVVKKKLSQKQKISLCPKKLPERITSRTNIFPAKLKVHKLMKSKLILARFQKDVDKLKIFEVMKSEKI